MDSPAAFTRSQALVCVVVLWAAIYLPCLGSLEIKGEEGRRLLPAVAMLAGGSWVVPQIGGVDYLSKPPLINWLAAGALRVAEVFAGKGTRTEWAARAPSVLAVLALALVMTGGLAEFVTPAGALFAATCALTNLGLMEKGRLAEIEALYISLYGIALVLWLGGWRRDALAAERGGLTRATWRTWTLPWVFLGLGLLTKGPLHLLFFYAVVLAVIGCAGRWREFFSVPHLVGVVLMLGLFALWAVPYFHQTAAHRASGVWLAQFQGRLEVNEGVPLRCVAAQHSARPHQFSALGRAAAAGLARAARGRVRRGPRDPRRRTLGGAGLLSSGEPRARRPAALHAAAPRARERPAGPRVPPGLGQRGG